MRRSNWSSPGCEDEEGDIWCDTVVAITLEQHGKSTLLTLNQTTFATVAHCDEHAVGWNECLDCLTSYANSLPPTR